MMKNLILNIKRYMLVIKTYVYLRLITVFVDIDNKEDFKENGDSKL